MGRRPASRVGRRGERAAAWYLRRRGYRVLAQNLDVGIGEADLVCLSPDRTRLVVVEVKTRMRSVGAWRPESQVGAAKQKKLRQVTQAVLKRFERGRGLGVRIDVVAVELRRWPGRSVIRHHERAVSWTPRR